MTRTTLLAAALLAGSAAGSLPRVEPEFSADRSSGVRPRSLRLNFRVIRELADADTRAQWFAGDYFGDRFAPGAPKVTRPATR